MCELERGKGIYVKRLIVILCICSGCEIAMSSAADDETAKLISMGFGDDGALNASYSKGQATSIAKLKIRASENSGELRMSDAESYLIAAPAGAGETIRLEPKEIQ